MATQEHLITAIDRMRDNVEDLHYLLKSGCSKTEFFESLDQMESLCKILRSEVIIHSRQRGEGVKKNGEPDRRFNKNRQVGLTLANTPDLRFSKKRRA